MAAKQYPARMGEIEKPKNVDAKTWYQEDYEIKDYRPDELKITENDGILRVDGAQKREMSSKSFFKEFILPDGFVLEKLQCVISSKGVLTIAGPVVPEGDGAVVVSSDSGTVSSKDSTSTKTSTQQQQQQKTTTKVVKSVMDLENTEIESQVGNFQDISKEVRQVNKKFETKISVKEYKSENIQVKITRRLVIITAKSVTETTRKELYQKFTIPAGVKPETITSTVDEVEGTLTISAPIDEQLAKQQQQQEKQQITSTSTSTSTSTTSTAVSKNVSQVQEQESVRKSSLSSTTSEVSSIVSGRDELVFQPRLDSTTSTSIVKSTETTITEEGTKDVCNDGKELRIVVKLTDYKPEEIQVKVTKTLVKIEAHHKTETTSKSYYKEFTLPDGVQPDSIKSSLTPNGILTITATIITTRQLQLQQQQQGLESIDRSSSTQVSKSVEQQVQQESTQSYSVKSQQTRQVIQSEHRTSSMESTSNISTSSSLQDCVLRPIMDTDTTVDQTKVANLEDISKEIRQVDQGNKFEVSLNVPEFKPEGLQVRISKNMVIIEGKIVTETTRKEFVKKFTIPPGVKPETIASSLSPNGVLTISAPIVQTSPSQKSITDNTLAQQHQQSVTSSQTSTSVTQQESENDDNIQIQGKIQKTVTTTKTTRRIEKACTLSPTVDLEEDTTKLAEDTRFEDVSKQLCPIDDGQKFEVKLDVPDYAPEEIQVKISKNTVTIIAQQEVKEENKIVKRQLFKKFTIPAGVPPENITSTLSENGVLTISVVKTKTSTVTSTQQQQQQITQTSQKDVTQTQQQQQQQQITNTTESDKTKNTTTTPVTKRTEDVPVRPIVDLESDIPPPPDSTHEDLSKEITKVDKKFSLKLNVSEYTLEEVQVKIYKRIVIIEARSKTTTKSITKKFTIPEGVNPRDISTNVSPDGTLAITGTVDETKKQTTTTNVQQVQQQQQQKQQQQSTTTSTSTTSKKSTIKTRIVSSESLSSYNFDDATTTTYDATDKKVFEETVEINGYEPEELEIKMAYNIKGFNWVIVEGTQEMSEKTNWKSKMFRKMFTVPAGVKLETVVGSLSDDGKLMCITAPIEK